VKEEDILMIQLNPAVLDRVAAPPGLSLFERLAIDLQPAARILAQQIAQSQTGFAVLAFLHCYPRTALTAGDLAARIARPPADVTVALTNWVVAGLIEGVTAGDMIFYRLARDSDRLCDLEEVFAWQEFWMIEALSIAQAVGVPLADRPTPDDGAPGPGASLSAIAEDWSPHEHVWRRCG
jgi:hypothetical protein